MIENIKIINISKKIKKICILNQLNFEIERGSVNAFIGENGAGKTTFMNIIAGLDQNYSGLIIYDGQDIKENDAKKILYFKTNAFFPLHLNLKNYIKQFYFFFNNKKIEEKILTKYFEDFDLLDRKNINPNFLSSGQKKKVILLLSKLINPDLLILDEPEANLDPTSRLILYKEVKKMANNGITIFISTHLISEIQDYVDYAIFIKKGNLMWNGEINSENNLKNLYKRYVIENEKSE